MSDTRPYYSTRQIINVDDFLSRRDTYYLFCISDAQLYALRKMAKTRLLWPTTWAKEQYEQTYLLPDATDWDLIDAHISEFIAESEAVEMCNNLLIEALQNINDTIRLSSCCFEAGPGGQLIDDEFYWGTEEPAIAPTSFGTGEEFETEAEYLAHKCEVANGIINGLIGSLNGISLLTLGSLFASSVVAGIVGLGLITVPPVAIILAVAGTGLAFAFFSSLADEIEDYKVDLVCALYGSETAQSAYDNLKDGIDGLAVDIGVVELQLGPLLDMVMQMAPINTMNALFTSVGLPAIIGETVTCSTACVEQWWECQNGVTVEFDATSATFSQDTAVEGYYYIAIGCLDLHTFNTSQVGWSNPPFSNDSQWDDKTDSCGAGSGWSNADPNFYVGPMTNTRRIKYRSTTAFSVTFTIS